jgi:hypothetical protein
MPLMPAAPSSRTSQDAGRSIRFRTARPRGAAQQARGQHTHASVTRHDAAGGRRSRSRRARRRGTAGVAPMRPEWALAALLLALLPPTAVSKGGAHRAPQCEADPKANGAPTCFGICAGGGGRVRASLSQSFCSVCTLLKQRRALCAATGAGAVRRRRREPKVLQGATLRWLEATVDG